MPEYILGISAYYHDSAAALLQNGHIIAAAHQERFSRTKHDASFPTAAITYVLSEAGIGLDDLSAVAFYDKPYLKFERLLETYHAYAPRGLKSFLSAMPVWIKEKLFMRNMLEKELAAIGSYDRRRLLFPEHHLSHAASAFYPSPFTDAAIVTIDGVGEWATTTIAHGEGRRITVLKQLDFPHSIGLLYSTFTYFCGFRVNSGEYKLMGLAPYGDPEAEQTRQWIDIIRDRLVDVRPDGSLLLNMEFFDYATGLQMCLPAKWEKLFGIPKREPESELTQPYMNLAYAIQRVTEEIVLQIVQSAKDLTGSQNLTMAGGVALNCVANGKILRSGLFDGFWVQPAAGDAGGALGAALVAHHLADGHQRPVPQTPDAMQGGYLGPEFNRRDAERVATRFEAPYRIIADHDALCDEVAALLEDGKVIGWFQGRMEYGPRALGNRSILGDPRNPEMQKKLNLKIKYREGFRPFAPSVLEEDISTYFELDCPTPYMLLVAPVATERCLPLPGNAHQLPMYERLYHLRSDVPAITHVDFSARIQSVSRQTNEKYWKLINAFKRRTGYGLLVNTSFNVRGEPIVCTPQDAYLCFMRTEMDYLVMGDLLLSKKEQPKWQDDVDWRDLYELD